MTSRKPGILAFAALLLSGLLMFNLACKKDNNAGSPPDISPADTIQENVVLIDVNSSQLLSDSTQLSEGTYIFQFSGEVPDFSAGDVIVGEENEGFLRHVNNVIGDGNKITLQTTQANMEDVFIKANIKFNIDLSQQKSSKSESVRLKETSINYLAKGVTMENDGLTFDFSNTVIYQEGALTFSIKNGQVKFTPNYNFNIVYKDKKLTRLEFKTENSGLNIDCDFLLNASESIKLAKHKKTLVDYDKTFVFGIVVVVVNTKLVAELDVDVSTEFNAETGFIDNYVLTLGANYESGAWSGIYDLNSIYTAKPVDMSGTVNFNQKLIITPEVSIKFLGVAGPYFIPKMNEEFDATIASPSLDWDASLKVGLDTEVGAKVEIFGYTLPPFSVTYNVSETIWNAPDKIKIISGNNQNGNNGEQLSDPIKVVITDNLKNTLENIPVYFEITQGGGEINYESILTDENGLAEVQWTMGNQDGEQKLNVIVKKGDGSQILSSPVMFTATTGIAEPYSIEIYSGNNQNGDINSDLPFPIEVLVKSMDGDPFENATVYFSVSEGSVSEAQSSTDAYGIARTNWTLGSTVGEQTLFSIAYESNGTTPLQGSPLSYIANSGIQEEPHSIEMYSGNNQTGEIETELPFPIEVLVKDIDGNPFKNATVHFSVTEGSVSVAQLNTDANGIAGTNWTLGSSQGQQSLSVIAYKSDGTTPLSGSPLAYTAIAGEIMTTFTDPRNGQVYDLITIGTQTWFAENLNFETADSWWYNNSQSNGDIYGRLYNWNAALDACPSGWHLPADYEWSLFINFLGDSRGGKMKEIGTTHWNPPNTGATNSSGFTGLPGGYYYSSGSYFTALKDRGRWWSSTEFSSSKAWGRQLFYNNDDVYRTGYPMTDGFAIRCIKD